MRGGEFPDYGFVLLDQGEPLLKVLDGTRRSIAFLEYGQTQIPVRVIQSIPYQAAIQTDQRPSMGRTRGASGLSLAAKLAPIRAQTVVPQEGERL
jgi:hypothetical protein